MSDRIKFQEKSAINNVLTNEKMVLNKTESRDKEDRKNSTDYQ